MDRNAEGCLRLLVTAVALFPVELRSSALPPPNHSISQLVSQQDLAAKSPQYSIGYVAR